MAFGADDMQGDRSPATKTISTNSPFPDDEESLKGSPRSTPLDKSRMSADARYSNRISRGKGSPPKSTKTPHGERKEAEDGDDDDDDQEFVDHEEMRRRLERRLGLCCYPKRLEDDVDEWKELAAVVGSRYISAGHLYPAFAATVARQNVSPSALLLCLIYIDRLHDAHPDVNVDHFLTSSDLFIVSLMSACKFLYDVGEVGDCYNGTWARDFGIPIKTLNKLEFMFLDALQWNLHADGADFDAMMHNVESEITQFGCQFRDYLTYSDLLVLADARNGFSTQSLNDFVAHLTRMLAALTAAYLVVGCVVLTSTTLAPFMVHMLNRPIPPSCSTCTPSAPFPSLHGIVSWMNWTRPDASTVCQTVQDDLALLPAVNLEKPRPMGTSLRLAAWKKMGRGGIVTRGRFVLSVA